MFNFILNNFLCVFVCCVIYLWWMCGFVGGCFMDFNCCYFIGVLIVGIVGVFVMLVDVVCVVLLMFLFGCDVM